MNNYPHDVNEIMAELCHRLDNFVAQEKVDDPLVVGIQTGGLWIAEHVRQHLDISVPAGALNIAFYRDDFSRIGIHPRVTPSSLPFEVEGKDIILVDDVLHTGRTIRAAMNEIFDYGRPASISLVVLVDRSGRELPIQADVVGKRFELKATEHVKLLGPEPLALEFK